MPNDDRQYWRILFQKCQLIDYLTRTCAIDRNPTNQLAFFFVSGAT